jgi:hypothetical protein
VDLLEKLMGERDMLEAEPVFPCDDAKKLEKLVSRHF